MIALLLLLAAELPTGQIIDKVVCAAGDPHSYALYLPAAYTPRRQWPILYCLDPGARGRIPVERFRAAAEAHGWIVAGSNTSRNGPWQPSAAAFDAFWGDTQGRFSIDPRRVYLAGFSGGARIASAFALHLPQVAGVIGCGAGFSGAVPKVVKFAWFGAVGVDDFNYWDVRRAGEAAAAAGAPVRIEVFSGAHAWPPPEVCAAAVDWMETRSGSTIPALAKHEASEEGRERKLYSELASAIDKGDFGEFRATVAMLAKRAGAASDSPDRRVARRVLSGEYVALMEQLREGRRKPLEDAAEALKPALGWWLRAQ
jgi:predicted esterase